MCTPTIDDDNASLDAALKHLRILYAAQADADRTAGLVCAGFIKQDKITELKGDLVGDFPKSCLGFCGDCDHSRSEKHAGIRAQGARDTYVGLKVRGIGTWTSTLQFGLGLSSDAEHLSLSEVRLGPGSTPMLACSPLELKGTTTGIGSGPVGEELAPNCMGDLCPDERDTRRN